jgi:hypothetical protein
MNLAPHDKELLRNAILHYLVMFHPGAFTADQIRRALPLRSILDFEANLAETESALDLLMGLNLASQVTAPLGATVYWRATAAGVLQQERSGH